VEEALFCEEKGGEGFVVLGEAVEKISSDRVVCVVKARFDLDREGVYI
jgi:hypothetical protein